MKNPNITLTPTPIIPVVSIFFSIIPIESQYTQIQWHMEWKLGLYRRLQVIEGFLNMPSPWVKGSGFRV